MTESGTAVTDTDVKETATDGPPTFLEQFGIVFNDATPLMLDGLWVTIQVSLLAIVFGLLIGLVTCFLGRSKYFIFRAISATYVWIIRGTPMIVQAFLVFFAMPQLIQMWISDFRIDPITAGLITLSLNAGAYMSEIFRGGIAAVPKGQVEAARSLGLSSFRTMIKIVLPQAFKMSIPSLVNQFIITIKDSSILTAIGMADLVSQARIYVGSTYLFFPTYIMVAAYYLVIISALMIVSKLLEKKLNYDKKS
ncbi:MAG: amino acid ABC transporter permease [Clostridia bacterium]|nr:amino acid ABC transporter permease [Clostridia bacterium]